MGCVLCCVSNCSDVRVWAPVYYSIRFVMLKYRRHTWTKCQKYVLKFLLFCHLGIIQCSNTRGTEQFQSCSTPMKITAFHYRVVKSKLFLLSLCIGTSHTITHEGERMTVIFFSSSSCSSSQWKLEALCERSATGVLAVAVAVAASPSTILYTHIKKGKRRRKKKRDVGAASSKKASRMPR